MKGLGHFAIDSMAVTQLLHQGVELLLDHLIVKLHVDYHFQVVLHLLLVLVLSLPSVLEDRVGEVKELDVLCVFAGVVGLLLLLLLFVLLLALSLFLALFFTFDHLLLLPLLLLLQLLQLVLADSRLLGL